MKKSEIIDLYWKQCYFNESRKPKDISSKIWDEFKIDAGNIIMTLKSKKYLRKNKEGWRQTRPSKKKFVLRTDDLEEIGIYLGDNFKKEISELKIALENQPNCSAFLMRKILEKASFIVLSRSDHNQKITHYKSKNGGELPQLNSLLNWLKQAEIKNLHVATPRNVKRIEGSKFLGDTSAHNYLTYVSFEEIKLEMPYWRILIKELAKNL